MPVTLVVGPEWPLAVAADGISGATLEIAAEADAAVREALAQRFGIVAIHSLAAHVVLRRLEDDDIAASAQLRATLSQACVVTFEPVEERVDAAIEGRFTARPEPAPSDETEIDPDDETDEPEPIVAGKLLLGEWLAQNLSLAMNPYPRAQEATLDPAYTADGAEDPGRSHRPFAGLGPASRRGTTDIDE